MNITELETRLDTESDIKLGKIYLQFSELLSELKKKTLNQSVADTINMGVEEINTSSLSGNDLAKFVKQKQTLILKQAEKELKFVPKNYYQTQWMVFGFTAFGLPIGVVFGLLMGNIGLMGLGIPIGMAIGFAFGLTLDKKALNEERQLNVVIKY